MRVHDLKHTFGRRLRTAGVPLETRKVLLGHKTGDITSHYSAPELAELIRAAPRRAESTEGSIGFAARELESPTQLVLIVHELEITEIFDNRM